MKKLVTLAFVGVGISATAPVAYAWSVDTCNGKTRGITSNTTFRLNRCSIPAGSQRETAILHAMGTWNVIQGMSNRFQPTSGSSSCSTTFGDDRYDISFVDDSQIDGLAGRARSRRRACTFPWDNGDTKEADVYIAWNLTTDRVDENSTTLGARETAIHELGHVLGANHEDDFMSVMCTSNTCGKQGERDSGGIHWDEAETVFPDDADMGLTYHGNGNTGQRDMMASSWRHSGGAAARNYTSVGTYTRCPGETINVRFSFGNLGKVNVTSSNPMQAAVVLSNNDTISTYDMHAADVTVWANRGVFIDYELSVTIPNLLPGTYFFGFVVDSDSAFAEDREGNNSSLINRKITVPSGC